MWLLLDRMSLGFSGGLELSLEDEHLYEMGERCACVCVCVCVADLGESGLSRIHWAATEQIAAGFWEHFPYSS